MTRTLTATLTGTYSPTPTPTFTSTFTPTSTRTSTVTSTLTPTPVTRSTVIIFPNPATGPGPVTFQISLASGASTVEIDIFTLSFRKVNTIILRNVPSGVTDVSYNLTDKWGAPLSNGIYYVVIRTTQERLVSKLMILK